MDWGQILSLAAYLWAYGLALFVASRISCSLAGPEGQQVSNLNPTRRAAWSLLQTLVACALAGFFAGPYVRALFPPLGTNAAGMIAAFLALAPAAIHGSLIGYDQSRAAVRRIPQEAP